MAAIVANAQALAHALQTRGVPVLGAHKGYTRTHQVIADVREFGGGLEVAHRLAEANIITNKNLLPERPAGATGTARAACASAPPRSPASAWARSRCRRSPT